MRASHKTAIGGISSASGVIFIYLLSFIPGFGLVSAMIMGFLLVFVREIAGRLTAYLTYTTTALILVFLCSKKLSAGAYTILFGYYPILFIDLEKIRNSAVRLIVKILLFESVGAASAAALLLLFPSETLSVKLIIAGVALYEIAVLAYALFIHVYFSRYHTRAVERVRSLLKIK